MPAECILKDLRLASTRDHYHPSPPTTTTVIHWDSETRQRPWEGRTKTGFPRSIARESHVMHFYANTANSQTRNPRTRNGKIPEFSAPSPDLRRALGGLGRRSGGFHQWSFSPRRRGNLVRRTVTRTHSRGNPLAHSHAPGPL